ncbi:MAG: hypothetical protein VX642_03705 [Bdellovibrionota bacterium]|nr:hypothetical protein [Bdellovibrionota bacterium]
MDIVPCIPAESSRRQIIFDALSKGGASDLLAENVSSNTSNITDNRHPDFESITDDWQISNPEGYAKWFESQITNSVKKDYMEKAQVDELPLFKRKAPLQRVIQILKRHRDIMFQGNEDSKPISIIITTLAAKAYNGEMDLESSLISILSSMGSLINSSSPRIPNPVDPAEDFSDKWGTAEGGRLQLEENFWNWLEQANRDFDYIFSSDTTSNITTQAARKFLVKLDEDELQKSLGLRSNPVETKKVNVVSDPSPPWTSSNK